MSLESSSNPDSSISKDMLSTHRSPFEIGEWLVEPDLLRIVRDDASHKLEPMAMRLLVFLAERPAEVISRAEILKEVWEERVVVDETLSRGMSLVRQALGDNAQDPSYIETIPKRGYRLIASVRPHIAKAETLSGAGPSELTSDEGRSSDSGPLRWRMTLMLVALLALVAFWQVERSGETAARDASQMPSTEVETPHRPGIAVMPFKNLSPEPGNAYLAEGLTEELIHQLASVSGLRVVSRTSSMHFRDSDALAPEVARVLGVDYLLEGTVLVIGQRLRISAQLIRPDQDDHLMSRTYDRDLSEVLDLQREVAKDVAENTRTKLSPTEATRLTRDRPVNSEAYRTYLQGHQLIQRRREVDRGLDQLQHAVDLDPGFAPAWAALADAYLLSNSYAGRSEDSAYSGAEAAITKALELDPKLAAAHASLGLLRVQRDHDWPGSESSYRRAIELERSYVTARQWYSELLSITGRHDEALHQIGIALELDPLSPLIHAAAGQRLNAAGRYLEALNRFQDVEALGADFSWHLRERSWALTRLGRHRESLDIRLAQTRERRSGDDSSMAELEQSIRQHGLSGYYASEVERLLAMRQRGPGYPTWLATAYAGAGQTEEAFEWLAAAAQKRNLWLLHTLKNPAFDGIREHPRFAEILGDLPPWHPETGPMK